MFGGINVNQGEKSVHDKSSEGSTHSNNTSKDCDKSCHIGIFKNAFI